MLKNLINYFDLYRDESLQNSDSRLGEVTYWQGWRTTDSATSKRRQATVPKPQPKTTQSESSDENDRLVIEKFRRGKVLLQSNPTILLSAPHRSAWGQWAALFAGILIQPFFQTYQSTHRWVWDGLWGWSLFAVITSVLVFPAVYRNAFDPDKPLVIQLAPIFAAGLGWQSLLSTAIKAVTK